MQEPSTPARRPWRAKRLFGLVGVFFGLILMAEGARPWLWPSEEQRFTWMNGLSLLFGVLPIIVGVYYLFTGVGVSRYGIYDQDGRRLE